MAYGNRTFVKRNMQMAVKSKRLMENSPDLQIFFFFGINHFTGQKNIIEVLRENGYKVKKVGESQSTENKTNNKDEL